MSFYKSHSYQSIMLEKYWIALVKENNEYYALAGKDKSLTVRDSEEKYLNDIACEYSLAQLRGIQGITSLFLHNLTFEMRVVQLSMNEIEKGIFDLKKGVEFAVHGYSFGSMPLLKCNGKKDISKLFKEGKKPRFKLEGM